MKKNNRLGKRKKRNELFTSKFEKLNEFAMRKISGVHKHSSVIANHVETDILKLQELVDGIKLKMIHKIYNMDEKHRIKSQLQQCILNEETINTSVYWKQAFVSISKLLEYKNIDMNTYLSLPKGQIKEIVNDFLVHNLQQKMIITCMIVIVLLINVYI